jgi:hypothetical protein
MTQKPRRSRKVPPDIKALRAFVREAEKMDEAARYAAIRWLVSRYLGEGMARFI